MITNSLLVEAQKQLEEKKAKASKEKVAKERANKAQKAVAERTAKAKAALQEGAQLAGQLSNLGRRFCPEDLSKEALEALSKIRDKGNLGICASCRWTSGCLRCDLWKAERYWLGKEDPQEEKIETELVSDIDKMFQPSIQL